jgi:poly(3-hydroxybutyrate) depolymerase
MVGTGGTIGAAGTSGAAGMSAAAGSNGAGGSGSGTFPTGPSSGCNMPPAATDSSTNWVKRDIDVTGVPADFIATYTFSYYDPVTNKTGHDGPSYTWTHRNYFVRLPTGYDPSTPYPVVIGGSGCGGSETVGSEGGYSVLGTGPGETQAIQVSLSYVNEAKASPSGCIGFADDFTNSPEPAYIRAAIADMESKYCIDKSKVFLSGYSSGAWEATLSGCTNSDELRGYGVQIGGGLRLHRPACTTHPVAAIYVVGKSDTSNPIGPLTSPNDDSYGSAPSRDDILTRNGCTDKTTTAMWDPTYPMCVKYTGCPAQYPVVWCALEGVGHNPDPNDATVNLYRYNAIWKFYSTLP